MEGFLPSAWRLQTLLDVGYYMPSLPLSSPVKEAGRTAYCAFERHFVELDKLHSLRSDLERMRDLIRYDPVPYWITEDSVQREEEEYAKQCATVRRAKFELVLAERRRAIAPIYEASWQQQCADAALAALATLFKTDEE